MTANVTKSYFAGKYVDGLRDVYLASLLSGLNSVAVGAPGWGKTDVPLSMLNDIMPAQFTLTRLSPSTAPEEVKGAIDVAALMNLSEFRRNVAGTPYDVTLKAHLVDEVFRANAIVLQDLMFLTDRKDVAQPAPVLANANFLPKGAEFEALLNRFGLWHWVEVSGLDAADMARAMLTATGGRLHVRGALPTVQELDDIKAAVPGPKAIEAVANLIGQLASDVTADGLSINPRRVNFWQRLLFRCGVYYSGSNDFSAVPDAAIKMLRFAWECHSPEEYRTWVALANSISDPVAAAIDEQLASAADVVNSTVDAIASNPGKRAELVGAASMKLTGIQQALSSLGGDPRVAEANMTLMGWFGAVAGGRKVER